MAVLGELFGLKSTDGWPAYALEEESPTGVNVTPFRAMNVVTLMSGVRCIAETIGYLPAVVYRTAGEGRERAVDSPAYRVLHDEPNPEMSACTFKESIIAHAILWGNGYAEIEFDGAGRVKRMWLLRPDRVRVKRAKNGDLVYKVKTTGSVMSGDASASTNRPAKGRQDDEVTLPAWKVFHVMNHSFNGLVGMSCVRQFKETIALAIAQEQYGAAIMGNGSQPGGVLERPKDAPELNPEGRDRLRRDFENLHRGPRRAGRVAILEEGMTWKRTSMPPADAQWLDQRRFSILDFARMLRLPPHKLQDEARATHSNIYLRAIDFVQDAIMPWTGRFDNEANRKLFTPGELKRGMLCEHVIDGLLKGDTETRYNAYATLRQAGGITANQIARKENFPPIPPEQGGDEYLVPANMMPMRLLSEIQPPNTKRPEDRQVHAGVERRMQPLLDERSRLGATHRPLLEAAVGRWLGRALREIRRRMADLDTADFTRWLSGWLDEHAEIALVATRANVHAYLDAVSGAVLREVALDHADFADRFDAFAARYAQGLAWHNARQMHREIERASNRERVLDRWQETGAQTVVARELVRGRSASAVEVYSAVGRQRLVWRLRGGACELCREMDGRTVALGDPFLSAGDTVEGGDEANDLEVKRTINWPPLHSGCDCDVAAE